MNAPTDTKTCPRCKGRGWLPKRTAARIDGACLQCGGRCVVPTGAALRALEIARLTKWSAELVAEGKELAARPNPMTHEVRMLNSFRTRYASVRAALRALEALPTDASDRAIVAAARA